MPCDNNDVDSILSYGNVLSEISSLCLQHYVNTFVLFGESGELNLFINNQIENLLHSVLFI